MELLAHETHLIAIKPCFSISKFIILKNINTDKLLNLKINNSKIEYITLRKKINFRHFIVFYSILNSYLRLFVRYVEN